MHHPTKQFSLKRTVKRLRGISFGIVTLHCFVLVVSLQSAEQWKPLFNGKDFTGWTVPVRGDQSLIPAAAGWKIKGNVLWLDTGDEKFPNLRKRQDWNHVQISFKGQHLQVTLNGTKICDVTDNPTDPAEAAWKEAGPISFQWPHGGGALPDSLNSATCEFGTSRPPVPS